MFLDVKFFAEIFLGGWVKGELDYKHENFFTIKFVTPS